MFSIIDFICPIRVATVPPKGFASQIDISKIYIPAKGINPSSEAKA
jgi:hypothetical protein